MSDWIHTFTGRRFYPLSPRPQDVCIEDIAHALSLKCRWTGHCATFYSIAQHSIHVAQELRDAGYSARVQLAGLLHDAGEAYLPDMASPIKHRARFTSEDATEPAADFHTAEDVLLEAICVGLGVPGTNDGMDRPEVKHADLVMLATEARDLMHGTGDWPWQPPAPRVRPIDARNPEHSECAFRSWFDALVLECRGAA